VFPGATNILKTTPTACNSDRMMPPHTCISLSYLVALTGGEKPLSEAERCRGITVGAAVEVGIPSRNREAGMHDRHCSL
jgi:hypothetical protein